MNFKKRVNGSWADIPHYIHNTSTDTITTLPTVIYPNNTTATVGLKGQTVQSSTPSPTSPVIPQGCGKRTGNLFDKDANDTAKGYVLNEYLRDNGETTSSNDWRISEYIEINERALYTLDYKGSYNAPSVCFYDNNKNFISGAAYSGRLIIPIGTPEGTKYCRFSFRDTAKENIMFNTGSTALPYEPYGYKILISSANTTTPVYLGEVQTTRKIGKYEFTGSETWRPGAENYYSFVPRTYGDGVPYSAIICSHCSNATINNTGKAVFFKKTDFPDITTGEELKQYCSNQYAAGTPVTVWYVLATPETAVVNEPLMKIGNYADEVSGITIPVTAGGDTISVDATLQPSEMSATYKGWHPAIVHERTNGAWT